MKLYEQVLEGVFWIKGKRSNMYLLKDDEYLMLVDTGMPGDDKRIVASLHDLGYRAEMVKYIFVTHAHLDHVGSLAAVKAATGAHVVASRHEKDHLEGRKMLCSMKREGVGGKIFKTILFLMETFLLKYAATQLDISFVPGDTDRFGGIQIIPTPGHSPGSLSFYHHDKKLLCTGDALSGEPSLRLPPRAGCSSYTQALDSARTLASLEVDICLFGHGSPLRAHAQSQLQKLTECR